MERKELFRQSFMIEIARYTDGTTEVIRSFPLKPKTTAKVIKPVKAGSTKVKCDGELEL